MDDGRLDALRADDCIRRGLAGGIFCCEGERDHLASFKLTFNQLTVAPVYDVESGLDRRCRSTHRPARRSKFLPRSRLRFVNLIDVTAVDYPGREKRFDVIYHFLSPTLNARVRLRAEADETTQVPSIIEVFPGADWFERECYDLYGVIFTGHPDMRRLLTDYGFDGHPLRKDFPLTGFVEVRYDDQEKRVVYEPVRLNQEFRKFDFLSPWEGATIRCCPGMRRRAESHDRSRTCATSPSISGRSIRPRTACCAWCWSSTAKWSPASIRISACCIAAPRS
jgi:NADH-quinone oxidoreductase subunit C